MGNVEIYGVLVLAIFAGWLMGKLGNRSKKQSDDGLGSIFHDYFVGLNYLLNDEPDEATMARATELFGNIDTNDNGFISKEEFLAALDYGDLEMTDEIKEYVDCRGNAEELLFFCEGNFGEKEATSFGRR